MEDINIDTNLYSRQIGTFGIEMMGKLQKLNVLIIGLKSSGIEIAKNLMIMGVESICIQDDDIVQQKDLGTNYYLHSDHVNKFKVSYAVLNKLKDLNANVHVDVHEGYIDETLILMYDVVVCCDQPLELVKRLNNSCRNNSKSKRIGFISSDTFGMIGAIFVDFGSDFICYDATGRDIKTGIVEAVTNEKEGLVTLHVDKAMDFQTGDYVKFSEVQGMVELNSLEPIQIKVVSKDSFTIGDTTYYSNYTNGGIVTEVRRPKYIDFRSFEDCILSPVEGNDALMTMDYSLIGRAEQLHWISMAYRMKGVDNSTLQLCKELNSNCKSCKVDEIDEKLFNNFIHFAHLRVPPLASFVGGVVAHEVIKFTGKYHPIYQWLYCDFTLPSDILTGDFTGMGFDARYTDQISIWGSDLHNLIQNAKIFIVGSGALGCEFIKNFALLGCGTQNGSITITDNDHIELSNISRQFLFQSRHVGLPKSKVAVESALEINGDMKILPLELRVGEDTEDYFDEKFWSNLTIVVNALDNLQARQYVDGKCVWYEKPLIESGTLGTMGNVQVIIPHLTQCYSESQDPPETSIPLCTLKHFPYQVEHTIEWAKDLFVGIFTQLPLDIKNIYNNHDIDDLSIERLRLISRLLKVNRTNCKLELLKISAELFNQYFVNDIQQLLHTFPKDHILSNGQPFWSTPKRTPTPLTFNTRDTMTKLFVKSTTHIFSTLIGIDVDVLEEDYEKLSLLRFPSFKPKLVKLSQDNQNLEVEETMDSDDRLLLLNDIRSSGLLLTSVDFEKDDDSNYHVDFIWSCSVLRCRNYTINECDRMKAKLISGKIIPAIATTTSMIGGLVTLEFIKALAYKLLKIDSFRNSFACLATPIWLQSEPLPPTPNKDKEYDPVTCGPVRCLPQNFTIWDKLHVFIPNGTIKQLIDWIKSKFNIDTIILSTGNLCVYNSYLIAHKNDRLHKPITELYESLSGKRLSIKSSHLVVDASCVDSEGIDVVIPTIKFDYK